MNRLLSSHDRKMLILLEKLYEQKTEALISTLSEELEIPVRTISSYIQEFNQFSSPITIISNNRGVKLYIPERLSFRYVYRIIYEHSLEFNLLEQIFLKENQTLESLAFQNFVSFSTIKRTLSRMKKDLARDGIELCTAPLSLVGNEEQVRQLINFIFAEKYVALEFIAEKERLILEQLITQVFHARGMTLYFNQTSKYIRWIYLNVNRLLHGHSVALKEQKFSILPTKEFQKTGNLFQEEFGIPLTAAVLNDMFYQLNNNYYFYSYSQLVQILVEDPPLEKLFDRVTRCIHTIAAELNIALETTREQRLVLDFVNILQMKSARNFALYDRRKIFIRHLAEKFPYIETYLASHLAQLSDEPLSEGWLNELTYILITHWAELYDQLSKIKDCIHIYIRVDTDIEHALFIKQDIEKYCRYNIRCQILMQNTASEIPDDALLLTTLSLAPENAKHCICFSEYLTNQDWLALYQQLDLILSEKKQQEGLDNPL
ncbi:helix-turn-helix domain-containing protein [Enterococcus canis]|nr:helix-turn-helix domain-containing protein [Enterococcus canis]